MTYDASNRKDIRRAEKEARAHELARIDYLKAAMSVAQGRHWFYDLLEFCGCWRESSTFESNKDYYLAGMRNVGLRMFADITANCPDEYITMVKEANGRRISADVNRNRDTSSEHSGGEGSGRDVEGSDVYDTDGGGEYVQ